jgi:glutamate synthase, NADH/NADPH, small subunit
MGKTTGFLEYKRRNGESVPADKRIKNFDEFHGTLSLEEQKEQGARCMACGVPFCQYGEAIAGMTSGCPLHNLVPEFNDLVYRGRWEQAYERLAKTHGLAEFTCKVCPALCEKACTCGLNGEPVSTKENERAIIEYAFDNDLVKEPVPSVRTGKKIAIIGSGPAGLAAAQRLNRRGHFVTVFERNDRVGGLLRYGIPNMKLDKRIIDRRVKLLEDAGVEFICNTNVGVDISAKELEEKFDRIILCCGASQPRDLAVKGRDAKGIYFAVDFLSEVSKKLMDLNYDSKRLIASTDFSFQSLKDKNVIIVGGGDTGNDCVGTSIRLGAASVVQLEMMPKPAKQRSAGNPWPEWPKVFNVDYGQEEAIAKFGNDPRVYTTTIKEILSDDKGHVKSVITVLLQQQKDEKTGRMNMVAVEGSEKELKADLVLIAAGFIGAQDYVKKAFDTESDARGNVKADNTNYETSRPNIFAAGDVRRGQSLVVWAMAEGRAVAKAVDKSLMGYTN